MHPRPLLALAGFAAALMTTIKPAPAQPACPAPEARQFDFWLGEWDVENHHRNPAEPADTTWYDTGTATDRVYTILDGCAIVEHWRGRLTYDDVMGFSVRAWDPERRTWAILLNWPGAAGPAFTLMEGRFEDGVGTFRRTLERPDGPPVEVRFRFSDVSADAVRWEGATSTDGGATWRGFWTMDFRRRDPARDAGLLNGPARGVAARCADERARAFDFLVGDWAGEETTDDDTRPVEVRAWSILEGCAIMDVVMSADSERFRVRSFVPAEERWVQYTLDRGRPTFVAWDGGLDADRALVALRPDGTLERVRWHDVGADAYQRDVDRSADGGDTWRTVSRARFERR